MNAVLSSSPDPWPKIKLRFLAHCQLGKSIAADAVSEHGPYPVYRASGVHGYTEQYSHAGQYVLVGARGGHCGEVYFADGEFWASEQVIVLQAKSGLCDIRWLELAVRALNLTQVLSGSGVPMLPISTLLDCEIAVPPLVLQRHIVDYVTGEMRRMDAAIGEMENVIALTKDRRIALTQAAATGRLRLEESST